MDALEYWDTYYSQPFLYGMGTENILRLLAGLPPVATWIDLGCGSESLLWACAIRAGALHAVDSDGERLRLLEKHSETTEPTGSYATAIALAGSGRSWDDIRATLRTTTVADCLTDQPAIQNTAELVTQFGLLGLCESRDRFRAAVTGSASLLAADGWVAGANWVAADKPERIQLDEQLYLDSFADNGIRLDHVERIASTDPAYPFVWMYRGKRDRRGGPSPSGSY